MSLAGLVHDCEALATRVAQEFNTLRSSIATSLAGKADDSAVVHTAGAETISGAKTFTIAPLVPTPGSPGNPVRNDDARNSDTRTPTDGSVTNAKVAGGAAIEEAKLALASDAAAGIASRRTLGANAQQAAAGNHAHASYAPLDSPTFTGTVTLPADPTTDLGAATKHYVDAVSIADVGAITGTWTPDPTLARQIKATATAAVTIAAPTTGKVDGAYLTLPLLATGATQTITIDAAIARAAGWPASFQLPVDKRALVLLRYDGDLGHWACLSQAQEQ